ncbi:MAG TPA: heavy metal translocating P-type ATPase, partial [Colwellia sp.]|nr:heavy metal translocating P-type ATPase [Colwellia sp.]
MKTTTQFKIDGLTCASCVGRVEKALHKVIGVTDVTVNLATDTATIQGTASFSELIAAVIETGYQVPIKVVQFGIGKMSCASCVKRVEQALLKVTGVVSASVNLATEHVQVKTLFFVTDEKLEQAVTQAGYLFITQNNDSVTSPIKQQQPFYTKA